MGIIYKPKRMVSTVPGKERTGYFAMKVNSGMISMNTLCKSISEKCSLTSADVKGVVEALVHEIEVNLTHGRSIQVGDLGIFSASVTSPVVDTPEELTPKKVRIKNVTFLPSVRIKETMKEAQFIRQKELD